MYIIDPTEKFSGSVQNTITVNDEGEWYADYSSGQTWEEYKAESGREHLKVIEADEMEKLYNGYVQSLITTFTEIDEETYDRMLNCLPPQRWHTYRGVNIFYISEAYYANIHACYTRVNEKYYTADRLINERDEDWYEAFVESVKN